MVEKGELPGPPETSSARRKGKQVERRRESGSTTHHRRRSRQTDELAVARERWPLVQLYPEEGLRHLKSHILIPKDDEEGTGVSGHQTVTVILDDRLEENVVSRDFARRYSLDVRPADDGSGRWIGLQDGKRELSTRQVILKWWRVPRRNEEALRVPCWVTKSNILFPIFGRVFIDQIDRLSQEEPEPSQDRRPETNSSSNGSSSGGKHGRDLKPSSSRKNGSHPGHLRRKDSDARRG